MFTMVTMMNALRTQKSPQYLRVRFHLLFAVICPMVATFAVIGLMFFHSQNRLMEKAKTEKEQARFTHTLSETQNLVLTIENLTLKATVLKRVDDSRAFQKTWAKIHQNVAMLSQVTANQTLGTALKNSAGNLALSSGRVIAFASEKNASDNLPPFQEDRVKFSQYLQQIATEHSKVFSDQDQTRVVALFLSAIVSAFFLSFLCGLNVLTRLRNFFNELDETKTVMYEAQTMGGLSEDLAEQLTAHSSQLSGFTNDLSKQLALEQLSLDKCICALQALKKRLQTDSEKMVQTDQTLISVAEKLTLLEKNLMNLLEIFSERIMEFKLIHAGGDEQISNCLETYLHEASTFLNQIQGLTMEVSRLAKNQMNLDGDSPGREASLLVLAEQLQVLSQSFETSNSVSLDVARLSSTLRHQSKALEEGVTSFVTTIKSADDQAAA